MALPSGTNKCIGSYANESTGKFYSFIYNSLGNHTINELDTKLNTISIILQGSFLNFQEFQLINGVGIVDNKLLYWTDGYNSPRSIDIEKAKSGEYYLDSNSINLIKAPPQQLITSSYANDPITSTASNRLKGQLFQFRYLYVYSDGSRSAWSSCSAIPLPQFEITSANDVASYKNNNIRLNFNVGTKFVSSIEIAAQVKGVSTTVSTTDWFSISTLSRDEIVNSITNKYNYNSLDNSAVLVFRNDGLYQSVDVLETDLAYDYIPLKSKTLDVVNGNVIVLGNNTEGYDNIIPKISLNTTYLEPTTNSLEAVGSVSFNNQLFKGVPVAGDVISFIFNTGGIDPSFTITYTVTGTTSGDLYSTLVAAGVALVASPYFIYTYNVYAEPILPGSYYLGLGTFNTLNLVTITSSVSANTVSSYKTNSKYQLGIVYYDDFNRSSYVQTNDSFIVETNSWGETEAKIPNINWNIFHSAPTWATKYQWVRTEQLTHQKFLYWVASTFTQPAGKDYDELDISTLLSYNTNNPNSILAYDFSPGDRCTIHRQGTSWVTGYDVQIVGLDIETENVAKLQIQKKAILTPSTEGILLEIYTPKTRSNASTEQFFYEFGVQYDCSNGVHSVLSGTFTNGDVYTRTRNVTSLLTVDIEDPNFSDFYKSNYSSNGRANIFAPQSKQLNLPTDIRYSDTYVPNTNINGLSRFYGDAFDTYDRVNGSIQKLAVRDNYLICFQELKTGYIPIMQSIIEDQGGGNNANVAISTKLLNKIRYYVGDFGIGLNPESFARFAGTMYFADPNRGFVLKLSGGLEPISSKGMDSYFTKTLSTARSVINVKLLGSYDPRNDEYLLTFNYVTGTGTSETIAFNENTNVWTSFYSFIPEMAGYIFNKYFSFKNGGMWEHNVNTTYNSFYGVTYPSIVQLTYNGSPKLIKSFLGVLQQGDSVWTAPDITTSISTISTPQHSSLIAGDFEKKEGVWFSSLLRDDTSPGGLLEGEDLKGNWIKLRLSNSSSSKINLLSVDVRAIPSYQGIK